MSGVNNTFIYDTNQLIEMVPNLKRAQKFLLDSFFPNVEMSETEFVSIDIDIGKRRMSPFVSPLVEGKFVESRRFQTNTFKPAYIKDKRAPDLRKPLRRQMGERIGGTQSGAERYMANLVFEMEDQVDMLDRRLEWMASQVMQTGKLTVSGEGFETVQLDFGRDASLTVVLAGGNLWGTPANYNNEGRDPLPSANIERWQSLILKKSGAVVTDLVFSPSAWNCFINDIKVYPAVVQDKMQTYGNRAQPGAQIKTGAIDKGWWGQYKLWVYNDWYVDDNNIEQQMLPDGMMLMCGPQMMGTRAFGMIMDPKHNFASLPFAPKTWTIEDPAQTFLMMQSSPIVIPSRVNACFAATVCTPTIGA